MKALVCGGRDYDDGYRGFQVLDDHAFDLDITAIRHGAARGADSVAAAWAKARGVPAEAFPADWAAHGRSAGYIRNASMIADGTVDVVIAFPGGRGTEMMISLAEKKSIRCIRVA